MQGEFLYSFTVSPDEQRYRENSAVVKLFRIINNRIELRMHERCFDEFRAALTISGIVVREIERVPYHEPERIK